MENLELLVAKKLLQLKTFSLQVNSPFIWANNRKSPVYFDDRKIFSYTYMRNFIKLELAKTVAELYPDADVIAGVEVNARGFVQVDEEMRTNLPGVFAAGDLRKKSLRQVVTAAADGAIAAVQAERFLRGRG